MIFQSSNSTNKYKNYSWHIKKLIFIFILIANFLTISYQCTFTSLQPLQQQKHIDFPQTIRLSNQQKFLIPLIQSRQHFSHYLNFEIKYFPQKSNQCQFKQSKVQYKKLAQSNKLFNENDQIVDILVLKKSQKVILADPYFNIIVYSTDQHKLLKLLSPKTSLKMANQQSNTQNQNKKIANSISMFTTEQEDYVYYLSSGNNSYIFSSKSLGSQIQKLNIILPSNIIKSIYYKGYIILISAQEGIFIYKVDKLKRILQKVQKIKRQHYHIYLDLEIDRINSIFYILTESGVQIYLFKPTDFPNPETHQFIILKFHDQIELSNYTRNHAASSIETNQHLNLQISSSNPSQNQIFILFRHNMRQTVIAQFVYTPTDKQATFLRYFKFQMQIKQIHTIQDLIVIVGDQILGMFPYGIDPRLIKQEFNGWITMSDVQKIKIIDRTYFVGITKNSIQYGGLLFNQETGLSCQFQQDSKIKKIIFSGNLTYCNADQEHFYNQYCSYSKTFILEPMDIVTTSIVSSSVWIVMLICTICIILGILIMLIMHKRKEDQIRKLQLYFEQKRRSQIPATSDRRGERD